MRCKVKNCVSDSKKKNSTKTFFTFPHDEEQQKKWIQFCKSDQPFNPKTSRICMDHFNDEDIVGKKIYEMGFAAKRRLKPGAIPCRFKIAAKKKKQRVTKAERREYKKIVDSLLMEADQPQDVQVQSISAEDFNETEVCAEPSMVCADPSMVCADPLMVCVPLMEHSLHELRTEDVAVKESLSQEDKIKILEKKVKRLQNRNKRLKDGFMHVKRQLESEICELKAKLAESDQSSNSFTCVNHLSEGSLTKPTRQFVEKVTRMENIFTD